MYIYIFVAVLLIFALWKERQALGCPENPLNFTDCDNANGKAVKGTRSSPSDPTPVVVKKIKEAADFADKWVIWRVGFLLSFPCVVLIYFLTNSPSPSFFTVKGTVQSYAGSPTQCFKTAAGDILCGLTNSFPSEKELVIGMFVITALVYFTLNFYKFHLINYAKRNVEEGTDILFSRTNQ